LKAAGLVGTLSAKGPFTVFAPSNEAFAAVPPAQLTYLLNTKDQLVKVLEYHVVSGDVKSGDLKNGEQVPTLEGSNLTVSITGEGNATTIKINTATVTTANVAASNGVVHIINKVLLPPGFSIPTIPELAASANLTTLVTALQDANLVATLGGAGPFTVFAPTNEAFAAVPNISKILKDIPTLTKILQYHVVSGEDLAASLKDGQELTTLEGQTVKITISGSDVSVNNAKVVKADVVAGNGVVHVIDAVLIPPASPSPAPPSPPSPSTCKADIMVGVNCDDQQNLEHKPTKTRDDCCNYCKSTHNCVAWTWNQDKKMDPDQNCYLKTDCKSQTKKAGVISGKMKPRVVSVVV